MLSYKLGKARSIESDDCGKCSVKRARDLRRAATASVDLGLVDTTQFRRRKPCSTRSESGSISSQVDIGRVSGSLLEMVVPKGDAMVVVMLTTELVPGCSSAQVGTQGLEFSLPV